MWNIYTRSRKIVEQIHKRLKTELQRLNLSAAAASRLLGAEDSQGLRDVVGGRKRATAELLAGLLPLGIDVIYVLSGIRPVAAAALDPAEQALLESYRRCPPAGRVSLIQTAAVLSAGLDVPKAAAASVSNVGNIDQHSSHDGSIQIGFAGGNVRLKNPSST